jgi:type VI secretion system VasD/TssJ family lipoprotein
MPVIEAVAGALRPVAMGVAVACVLATTGCGGTARLQMSLLPQNPNTCGGTEPHSVQIRIYQLNDAVDFRRGTWQEIWDVEPEFLGQSLVAPTVLTTVYPNYPAEAPEITVAETTRYVGVVGNFCQIEGDCWKQVIAVSTGSSARLRLTVGENCLSLREAG